MAARCLPLFISLAVTGTARAEYGYGGLSDSYGYGSTNLQSGSLGAQAAMVSNVGNVAAPTKDPDADYIAPPTSIAPIGPSTSTNPCEVTVPPECVFPFRYKGKNYTECTGADTNNALWCSKTYLYTAHFAICEQKCDEFPYGAVIGGSVGGALALGGIGAITGVVVTNQQKADKEKAAAAAAQSTASGVAITPIAQAGAVPTSAGVLYDKDTLAKVNEQLGAQGGNAMVFFCVAAVALLGFCTLMAGLAAFSQARRPRRGGVVGSSETAHSEDDEADELLLEGAQPAEV